MPGPVSELASRLAENAEAVCRHYLSNGRRHGRYWVVGDVHNTPGRSLYVRLQGPSSGRGAAGRWTDAATGEYGDLLDLIAAACALHQPEDVLNEARRFLGLLRPGQKPSCFAASGSPEAARRLFARSTPIAGTLAETYLRGRGIVDAGDVPALRYHPRCFYRAESGSADGTRDAWPALVVAVTDLKGTITGVQRTWLDPSGGEKAPVATPRRAMGHLLGHAVRLGSAESTDPHVLAVGEGVETVLSLRSVLPTMNLAAALSAGHLGAVLLPAGLRRLYIAVDRDRAGQWAADRLAARAQEKRIEALVLTPALGDFNDDLRQLGLGALADTLRTQLAPEDVARFWRAPERGGRS
jgi:hypothetical protein